MAILDTSVLVLNRLWQPVNICTARRAVGLLYLGHAEVVRTDEEMNFYTHDIESWMAFSCEAPDAEVVRSISRALKVPRIIVLSIYDRLPKKEVKFSRQNVFQRDNYTCQYCGKQFEPKFLNLDHVIPRDKGGRTTWENVVCSCIRCNTRKANKLPQEVNMLPLREPKAPRWRPFFSSGDREFSRVECESWRHFLEPSATHVQLST